MTRVLNFKAAAFVAVFGAALLLYANHSTIAARFNTVKATGAETSAVIAPVVTGLTSTDPLLW